MFYVYSDYTGDSEHVDTEKDAIAIAKGMISNELRRSETMVNVDIFKLYKTVTAISSITYNVEEIKSDA